MSAPATLAERLAAVREGIERARAAAGAGPVALVAVSKRHPTEAIVEALAAGLCDFGENYAQELAAKRAAIVDPRLRWHMIGPVQRNKAKLVLGVALIHTVDRLSLLAELDRRAQAAGVRQAVLVQVNVAGDPAKSGVAPAALPELLDGFAACTAVHCEGLMLIPEQGPPEALRDQFRALRRLRDQHAAPSRAHVALHELSMGMSDDFALAIAEGATMVRVGTAIFGARPG